LARTFVRRRRLLLIAAVCVWGGVWARAFQLQVLHQSDLSLAAVEQSDRLVRLAAPRGDIVDSKGRHLALNVARRSYFAYPDRETSTATLALKFASVRGTNVQSLRSQWARRDDRFTWMIRRCDAQTASRIDGWELPGVHPTWEFDREYPSQPSGCAGAIGFANADLIGAAGLELYYDDALRGRDGEGVFLSDAVGRRFRVDPIAGRKPISGARLHLTLDLWWQSVLSDELTQAVAKWKARSGCALLMDPYTGAILAMADVNPHGPSTRDLKSRLVSDVFEPGSTFKLVTFAAALSDGAVHLGEYFDGGDGVGVFSGRRIRDDKKHGVLSAREAFTVSSNVITGRVANQLAPGRLDYWVRRFGFGEPTGIDLPGESGGRIAIQRRSDFNIAQRAIGHGIAVTPIQLATAFAAVANGGYRVRPHLARSIEYPDSVTTDIGTHGTRILSPDVASLMAELMAGVVREGTARTIYDDEYPIAGKTGTAEKPDPVTGGYDKNKYMASFVGFYPADKPQILGLVILDEPEPIHYGGHTAAPVLLNTIRRGTAQSRLDPAQQNLPSKSRFSEDSADWSHRLVASVAPWISPKEAFAAPSADEGDNSSERSGLPGSETGWSRLGLTPVRETNADVTEPDVWPEVTGMNLKDALSTLRAHGALAEFSGSGVVIAQTPDAETPMTGDRTCRLQLQ